MFSRGRREWPGNQKDDKMIFDIKWYGTFTSCITFKPEEVNAEIGDSYISDKREIGSAVVYVGF